MCVTKLAGLVSRARNRLEPSVFYQKSYPGSAGVTVGNLTLGQKAGVSGNGRQEKATLIRIRDEDLASLGSNFVSLGSSKTNAKW